MREFVKSSPKPAKSKSPFLHLVGTTPKFYIQSNDPDEFADNEVDIPSIAAELTYNYKQYKADESPDNKRRSIKISCSPRLLTIANTIRHQVNFSRAPGIGPTLCCAMSLGINQLIAKRAIRKLSELSHSFQRTRKQGTSLELYIHSFFESRVDCLTDNGRLKNIELTVEVKNQIDMISNDTGLFMSSVAILAIYAAMVQQDETPLDFKREWQEHLDRSIETLDCKLNAAKMMMKSLQTQNERYAQ